MTNVSASPILETLPTMIDEFAPWRAWRASRYRTNRHHIRAYHQLMGVSRPSMISLNLAHLVTLASYGWLLQKRMHVSGPLILQFLLGGLETCIVQTLNTLLVDIFQETPSTAAAAGNIVRCGLAAAGIAGMKPLMNRTGNGWYFTMLSIIGFVIGSTGTFILYKFGMKWRLQRCEIK